MLNFSSIVLIIVFFYTSLFAELYTKGMGWKVFGTQTGATISVNPDKSYFSSYILMFQKKPVKYDPNNELDLYSNLFYKSLIPSYFLFEVSYYPLTDLGSYLYKSHKKTYDKFGFDTPHITQIGQININLIAAMASRYEVPYSFSFFLGDITPFVNNDPRTQELMAKKDLTSEEKSELLKKQTGSAQMGFVCTFGQRRAKRIEILDDNWFNILWKVKGVRQDNANKMAFRYEIGYLKHANREFIDAITFTALRDRALAGEERFSLIKNSKIEYSFQIPLERVSQGDVEGSEEVVNKSKGGFDITRYTTFQKLVVGVNFPLQGTYVLTTEIGFKWEAIKNLNKRYPDTEFALIFVPGLKW